MAAETIVAIHQFAADYGFQVESWQIDNQALHARARSAALMSILLGAAAGLILLTIMINMLQVIADDGKKRFGILQAMGLTDRQLILYQVVSVGILVVSGVLLAHLLSTLFIGLSTLARGVRNIADLLPYARDTIFWRYPFALHIVLSLAFILILLAASAYSMRKIIRASAVLNIRD